MKKSNKSKKRSMRSRMNKIRKTKQLSAGNTNNRRHIMKVEGNLIQLISELQQKLAEIRGMFQITEKMLIMLAKHATDQALTEEEHADLLDFIPAEGEEEGVGNTPTSDENADFVEETPDDGFVGSDFGEHGL